MYFLVTNSQGKVVAASKPQPLTSPDTEQPISCPSAEWAGVEAWAAQLPQPVDLKGNFPPSAVLFFDSISLANFCGRHGAMLYVTGTEFTEGVTSIFGDRQWTSLKHAVAIRPEDEGPQNPTGITSDYSRLWVPRSLFATLSKVFEANNESEPLWCVSSRA